MCLRADVKIDFFSPSGLMDVELLIWTANEDAAEDDEMREQRGQIVTAGTTTKSPNCPFSTVLKFCSCVQPCASVHAALYVRARLQSVLHTHKKK